MKSKFLPILRLCAIGFLVFSSLSAGAAQNTLRKKFQSSRSETKYSLNLEPVWLLAGGIGGKAEYFLTDRVSLGLGGMYFPKQEMKTSSDDSASDIGGNYKWERSEIAVGSNIMLTGNLRSNGFYINPAIGYLKAAISEFSFLDLSGSLSTPFLRLTAGYQWITKSHFRIGVGAGAYMLQEGEVIVADNRGREVYREKAAASGGAALDLHVGHLF